jgi:hypothetical protein
MNCVLCQSVNQAEFATEMMIHFSCRRYIDNRGVLAFPKISVCLDCGFSWFTMPEIELRELASGRVDSCDHRCEITGVKFRAGLLSH